MNNLIHITNTNGSAFITCHTSTTDEFLGYIDEAKRQHPEFNTTYKVFKAGKMPFEALPKEIQNEVKQTLKSFKRCGVTYENSQFRASTGCCIRSQYSFDHFVCGDYKAEDIYTEEERRQNFIESFGYAPCG